MYVRSHFKVETIAIEGDCDNDFSKDLLITKNGFSLV